MNSFELNAIKTSLFYTSKEFADILDIGTKDLVSMLFGMNPVKIANKNKARLSKIIVWRNKGVSTINKCFAEKGVCEALLWYKNEQDWVNSGYDGKYYKPHCSLITWIYLKYRDKGCSIVQFSPHRYDKWLRNTHEVVIDCPKSRMKWAAEQV